MGDDVDTVGSKMTFESDLIARVEKFAQERWEDLGDARVVPSIDSLTFGNSGLYLNVTVLYADISESTELVRSTSATLSAEYYKAFLHCASQIIKRNSGDIQAYDGDRVMGIFVGDEQADQAVQAALEINKSVSAIINPVFFSAYKEKSKKLRFTIGIDTGKCLATKVGVRNAGELAWVGEAANIAAKLNSFEGLDHEYPIRITSNTMALLSDVYKSVANQAVWDGPYNNLKVSAHYRSNFFANL